MINEDMGHIFGLSGTTLYLGEKGLILFHQGLELRSQLIVVGFEHGVVAFDLLGFGSGSFVLEPYGYLSRLEAELVSEVLLQAQLRPRLRLERCLQ